MPLPEALAARLAKRGIIKLSSKSKKSEPEATTTTQEEVIAEDYDDTPLNVDTGTGFGTGIGTANGTPISAPPEKFDKFQGWFSCPNKWNVYHECTTACQEQWKEVKDVDEEYNKKRLKMLLKYPLPEHWQEVRDIGICRYYYWNTETDLVSWLPPGHPKCRVSLSASFLRKQMIAEREERLLEETLDGKRLSEGESSEEEQGGAKAKRKKTAEEEPESGDSSEESGDEEKVSKVKKEKDVEKEKEQEKEKEREKDRGRTKEKSRGKERERDRRGKRKTDDALDPMDPAAYSDCPRGTWASGLPEKDEARTGVDTTASGPLFQMRPYPNPGAVLRANSAANTVGPKKPS